MGRGVSSGGGQSSLGYLFGSGETPTKAPPAQVQSQPASGGRSPNAGAVAQPVEKPTSAGANGKRAQNAGASPPAQKETPAGVPGNLTNNYHRSEGQNCGNFITVESLSTLLSS